MQKRTALFAAALVVLGAGCSGTTDFTITKTFDPVSSAGGSAVYQYTKSVDLAAEAGSAWRHRNKIKSLDLVGIDATMTANHTGTATTGSGNVVLTRGAAEVTVGTWTNEPLPATAPHSIAVTLNAAGVSLVEDALRDDGQFNVKVTGTTVAPLSFAAEVSLHLKMKYKVP